MSRNRLGPAVRKFFRPSVRFPKRSDSPATTAVAAMCAIGAVAATALAIWRNRWIDTGVYAVIAVVCASWFAARLNRRHGGPPRAAR